MRLFSPVCPAAYPARRLSCLGGLGCVQLNEMLVSRDMICYTMILILSNNLGRVSRDLDIFRGKTRYPTNSSELGV